jgi:glycerol-3-phosphate O-acyltransferase/dihydroxyacetone phosphate acyltransferase
MLTSNHSNSLTDVLLLVVSVPSHRRSLLRLTAKDSQFGRGTFTSRLIEASGTLPIKRPKDHKGEKLIGALYASFPFLHPLPSPLLSTASRGEGS